MRYKNMAGVFEIEIIVVEFEKSTCGNVHTN